MKQHKKNGFFTFIFSFMPGAAEMYMGFLKQGASIMILFLLSFTLPSYLGIYDFNALGIVFMWFLGFFHARNLATLQDEVFYELKDCFIWEEFFINRNVNVSNPTLKKWAAISLIVVGVIVLWNNISKIIYNFIPENIWNYVYPSMEKIPQVVIAILIIAIGFKLIRGKKEELKEDGR